MPQAGIAVSRDAPRHELGGDPVVRDVADGAVRTPRGAVPGRRTVTIQGRAGDHYVPPAGRDRAAASGRHPGAARSRPTRRPHERAGFRPDRVAMWAVLLGVLLVLVAATSSHAAILHVHASIRPYLGW